MNSTAQYFEECYHFEDGYTYSSISEFPESKRTYQILEALVALLDGFLIIPTVLLNVIAAKTIIKSSKLKEKPCFFLVLVQSLFDTGVGTISLPLYTVGLATQAAGTAKCRTNFIIQKIVVLFSSSSFITLTAITYERYMGIFHPLVHRTTVTKERLLKYIISPCFVSILITGINMKFEYLFKIVSALGILVFFIFSIFVYTRIFIFVSKRIRSRKRPTDGAAQPSVLEMKGDRQFLQEAKLAKSCFLVVLCYIICLLPLCFVFVLSSLDPFLANVIFCLMMTLMFFNSILNSIIFFWRNPILRRTVRSNPCNCISLKK